jgi:23S rRNA (guanosine2251-2'-O)-methyltransferase
MGRLPEKQNKIVRREAEPVEKTQNRSVHIYGVMPVLEAIRADVRRLDRVILAEGTGHHRIRELVEAARRAGVPVRHEPRAALDRLTGNANHQGVVAFTAAARYLDQSELLSLASNDAMLVLLDGVEDPHNLGAIIRTAECAGATAIVLPERRSAHVTETVVKTSAGATEFLKIGRVTNLATFIEELKNVHYWVVGVDEGGETCYTDYKYTGAIALVFGAEGHGLHRLVKERCDVTIAIPLHGRVASLNVSVAVGVILFEAARQRAATLAQDAQKHIAQRSQST